ncbi:MAG: hypothetical protein Q4F31_04805 [Eubacteriales bacterium]|nr:hypothetical protein [Eubacteriales bacterium]
MSDLDILKKCRALNDSNDILYYLIHSRKYDTSAVICAPCNYLFQNNEDQFFGTCLYVSENNIREEMRSDFPFRKTQCGIPMIKTTIRKDGVRNVSLDNRQIRELPYRYRPDSIPRFHSSFLQSYTCFECADVIEIIDPRAAMIRLCCEDADFRSYVAALGKRFEVSPEQMGLAGSAALGAEKSSDYDIVFYGNAEELRRIHNTVININQKQGVPQAYGLPLPFRFLFREQLVDAFYVCEDFNRNNLHSAEMICENVSFRCRVTDDTYALQMEPFFKVENSDFSYVLLAETFFHATIRKGNVIEGCGDILCWEHDGKKESVMLCREPFRQLKDYTRYYYQQE